MKRRRLLYMITLLLLLGSGNISGQTMAKFEYFFDADPGLGKGVAITLNKTSIDTLLKLSLTNVSAGLHTFYIRSVDNSGNWSITNSGSFIKYDVPDTVLNITSIEYFFDKDPGFGKGTPVIIAPGSNISNTFNLTVPDNGTDQTTFHLRVKDSYGRWSLLFDTTYNLCQLYKVVPNFGFIRYGNQFSLIDSSLYNKKYKLKWVYDDQTPFDTIINPVHTFSIGRHFVKLVAGSGCRIDSVTKGLFSGVESYSPKNILGGADYNVDVYGSGFDASVTATLNDGATVINPIAKRIINSSHAVFQFDFHSSLNTRTARFLDLAIHFPTAKYDTTIVRAIGFTPYPTFAATPDSLSTKIRPVLEVTPNQPGRTGANTWHTGSYSVQYTGWEYKAEVLTSTQGLGATLGYIWRPAFTDGGPTAKMVPFSFTFDGQLQSFQILGLSIVNKDNDTVKIPQKRFDSIPLFRYVDSLGSVPYKGWVYEAVIPEISPGETIVINYRYLTPASLVSELRSYYWIGRAGLIGSNTSDNWVNCITNSLSLAGTVLSFFPPAAMYSFIVGCGGTVLQQEYTVLSGGVTDVPTYTSVVSNMVWGCITSAPPVQQLLGATSAVTQAVFKGGNIINNLATYYAAGQQCLECFLGPSFTETWNFASSDPNEIVGPAGYDTTHRYINVRKPVPYQISFENKPEAGRSAQTVTIIDTLSNKFNLSSLQLTNFAIGDTVFSIPPFRKEYTTTVDLSSKQKVLVRFNAKLDSASRIMKWSFTSLDPVTKQVLTDTTLAGFLPPDKDGYSGKGSVSFMVFQDSVNNKNLDTISNRAAILFDNNQQILTNKWNNILDKNLPSGQIDSVRLISDTTFQVYFSSGDGESGMNAHELFASRNGGLFTVISKTLAKSVLITASKDSTYDLLVQPKDNVGNTVYKTNAETHFTVFNLAPVTGDTTLCSGSSLTVADTTKGGTWSSSDNSIATIDAAGTITALKAGRTVINYRVTRNGLTGTATKNITVMPLPQKPVITWSGTLLATSATNVSYQWLLNNNVVTGATSASYVPVASGAYRLRVTDANKCQNASDSIQVAITAISNINNVPAAHLAQVVPNPASTVVTVQFPLAPAITLTIELMNSSGEVVKKLTTHSSTTSIPLSAISSGSYYLKITGKDYNQVHKLLIAK